MKKVVFKRSDESETLSLKNKAGVFIQATGAGHLCGFMHGAFQVNQTLTHPMEHAMTRLYLRERTQEGWSSIALLGPDARGCFSFNPSQFMWEGEWKRLRWTCMLTLHPEEPVWFWRVSVKNNGQRPVSLDVIYGQDLGLASPGALQNNEAYACQYMDHLPVETPLGHVVMSRQSLAQDGNRHPWILQGCLNGTRAYATDAFQFFGAEYKQTDCPRILCEPALPSKRYQYEAAYVGLQTASLTWAPDEEKDVVFYAISREDLPHASTPEDSRITETISELWRETASLPTPERQPEIPADSIFDRLETLAGDRLDEESVSRLFPGERRHEERDEQGLLSFFYGTDRHVVLADKDIRSERQHGHVLKSGNSLMPDDPVLCTTGYMAGIFNAQIVLGNTNFNKLLSVVRNPLNILKSSGQRIFVETDGGWKLLGMASAFEMGRNHCRWVYMLGEDTLTVRTWVSSEAPVLYMDVRIEGAPRKLIITHDLVLGCVEGSSNGEMETDADQGLFTCRPARNELQISQYPETCFFILTPEAGHLETMGGDELLHRDGQARGYPCAVMRTQAVNTFNLAITGVLQTEEREARLAQARAADDFDEAETDGGRAWDHVLGGLRLDHPRCEEVQRLDDILRWYAHNAMIHYIAPHGLEQYSGAAWGVRDICQGPVEMLMAAHACEPMKAIIERVFEHQYISDGSWPQWFMFDRFATIQHHDSHGDIIIWPLKAVCDYIEYTDSDAILTRPIRYANKPEYTFTDETYPLEEHIEKLIAYIEAHPVQGTHLLSYGEGDWNDSLQPADAAMKTQMVSGWTVALVYQVFRRYEKICRRFNRSAQAERLNNLCEKLRSDYNRWMVRDGVVTGFIFFDEEKKAPRYLLHPSDETTGIHYRLLPMQRGIISEIFTPEQAEAHAALIHQHLLFPDGARLMDKPPVYRGGEEKIFRRAESAANFGREIGLHYVHAHIRYVESMAKLGRADDVLQGLMAVNPLGIRQAVPNAQARQANMYFSSSDADFADRYEASNDFEKLYSGQVPVKGGWRLYSSGPGLYIYQVLGSMLGFRECLGQVIFDPVMPKKLDGLTMEQTFHGKKITLVYHIRDNTFAPERIQINGQETTDWVRLENPYRKGGLGLSREAFLARLTGADNRIEIFM
ncbi:MAG: cellobiose phosphorylase [Spartobacteria bacterium]|nr:cellobiose phosphorylase [Spartobacteria bacterium]